VQLIASASASATNIPDYAVNPACQWAVIGEHIVRIPRCNVLAVANLSNLQTPDYPFPGVASAPDHLRIGAHAYVGFQRGADKQWTYTVDALAEFTDCIAVSFRAYVGQGWAAVNGLVFRTGTYFEYAKLVQASVRIVFDGITGAIVYTGIVSATKEAEPDGADPDRAALEAARQYAPEGMHLRVRSLDRPLPPDRIFRVDPETGVVIEVRY